jgi:ubiquinone/menaquinone biosynthesis C-methylase UbiE
MSHTFTKYTKHGPGYHWGQVGSSVFKHNTFVHARIIMVNRLVNTRIQGLKVLDIGCGDGVLLERLARLKPSQATGVDLDEDAIAYARKKTEHIPHLTFLPGSATALPVADHSFDTIVCSEVIEHLPHPEMLLNEIQRVWTGKGIIVITTPIRLAHQPLDPEHIQEFFPENFQQLIYTRFPQAQFTRSHPVFWKEFQEKLIMGKPLGKLCLNLLDIGLGLNPFLSSSGWSLFAIQAACINPPAPDNRTSHV